MANFVQINRSYQAKSRWEDIAQQIAAGNDGYLNVGDSVSCTLKNGCRSRVRCSCPESLRA